MPFATGDAAENNREVLSTIEALDASGAERIFVNVPLQTSESPETDARLRAFLAANADDIFLTSSSEQDYKDSDRIPPTDPYFTQASKVYSSDYDADFLRFVWGFSRSEEPTKESLVPLSFALANIGPDRDDVFIDYTIGASTIPTISSTSRETDLSRLGPTGKSLILGTDSFGANIRAPGADTVSPTAIHILAAESLMRGTGYSLPWYVITMTLGIALALGVRFLRTTRRRRLAYLAWCSLGLALFFATAYFGTRAFFADGLLLAVSYAIMRCVAGYRRRHLTVDPLTKLPNFTALKSDLSDGKAGGSSCLVIAKVARLDALFVGLGSTERRTYLREICNRLSLGDQARTVYYDGGKYFAFLCDSGDIPDLQGHLEGLRAVASQPVR